VGQFNYYTSVAPKITFVNGNGIIFYIGEVRPGTEIFEGRGAYFSRTQFVEGFWKDGERHYLSSFIETRGEVALKSAYNNR